MRLDGRIWFLIHNDSKNTTIKYKNAFVTFFSNKSVFLLENIIFLIHLELTFSFFYCIIKYPNVTYKQERNAYVQRNIQTDYISGYER